MEKYEIKSYEDLKPLLRVRLMDIKSNLEKLKDLVYQPVGCGLALVAYMKLPEAVAYGGIANLPRSIAEGCGVSEEQIMLDAMKSSVEKSKVKLCAMPEMIFGMPNGIEPENLLMGGKAPEGTLLVLTVEDGLLGASAFYYPGVKERIGEIVGRDYYMLPSSVHEVLVLPDSGSMSPNELAQMVRTINETEVSPQDRLCDNVFRYNLESQLLYVAAEPERRKERDYAR